MSVQRKKRMVGYFYLDKTGLPPQDIPHCPPCEYLIDNPLPARVAHVGRTDAGGAVTHSWSRNLDPAAGEDINNNTAAAHPGANAIIDGTNRFLVTPAPSGSGPLHLASLLPYTINA